MPLSRLVLMNEFHAVNLTLSSSRNDQCNTCLAHENNNLISGDEYSEHLLRKDQAREEKQKDKHIAIDCAMEGYVGPKTLVITVDLQAVLLAPALQASTLYYKQKLAVHNFVVYNRQLMTRNATVPVHEGKGGLSSNELCSCITEYLQQNLQYEENILCSDGCGYHAEHKLPFVKRTLILRPNPQQN